MHTQTDEIKTQPLAPSGRGKSDKHCLKSTTVKKQKENNGMRAQTSTSPNTESNGTRELSHRLWHIKKQNTYNFTCFTLIKQSDSLWN